MYIIIFIIAVSLISLAAFLYRYINEKKEIVTSTFSLGTIVKITLFGNKNKILINKSFDILSKIDDELSAFKPESFVSKISEKSGKEPQVVNFDTFYLIEKSKEYCKIYDGAFDITGRPIVKLWEGCIDYGIYPDKKDIDKALELVNYNDIILNKDELSVMLKKEGQSIDLGGIAKGFAADKIATFLKNNNVKNALIDLGGNVFALGRNIDNSLWKVGIQNPFSSRGDIIGILSVENKSVVTSGSYQKFIEMNGEKIHHIINLKSGFVADSEIVSVTIVSDYSIDGDGLSTGAFIVGVSKAIEIIEGIKNVDAIFITKDKKVYCTKGVGESFVLTNNKFTL